MWNDFFYYRRAERIAIVILLAAIGISLFVARFFMNRQSDELLLLQTDSIFISACDSFFLTLTKEQASYRYPAKVQPKLTLFDPNLTDSAGFVKLGLPTWVARNILRYRAKGGKFFRPEQFARVYGLDSLQFQTLLPYIRIDTTRLKKQYIHYQRDTLNKEYPDKFEQLTRIELNTADTTLLMKIPGIGRGFAAMLVNYRRQLGGFYSVRQLREIRGVSDSLLLQWTPWFNVDPGLIVPLEVNKAGITRLRNHPYLNFYQAKVMIELKREYKKLHALEELSLLEEFKESDLDRLKYYLNFD